MKNGPLIFLGGLIAMIGCWCGLVVAPVLGLGSLTANVDNTTGVTYPTDRPGKAKQGAEVYRSLGCGECHTRYTTQDTLWFGARITKLSTNRADVVKALLQVRPELTDKAASDLLGDEAPIQVMEEVAQFPAERAVELLKKSGSEAELTVHNSGDDLNRGWGERQSVARDYIYDAKILLGSRRIGPDLANIGSRAPEKHVGKWAFAASETNVVARLDERRQWHLRRLYNPEISLTDSRCPSYRFLFEEVSTVAKGPHEALDLPEKFSAAAGKQVVPSTEALVLVEWLLNQKADKSLPEAPTAKKDSPKKEEASATGGADESK